MLHPISCVQTSSFGKQSFVNTTSAVMVSLFCTFVHAAPSPDMLEKTALHHFETYCFDCHDDTMKKGGLDSTVENDSFSINQGIGR